VTVTPVYDAGGVRLYAGDCLAVMHQLVEPVDAIIADLPYGTTRNHWDRELPNKLLWSGYHALAGDRTPIVVFGSGAFTARFIVENLAEYRYSMVWAKEDEVGVDVSGVLNSRRQPLRNHEDLAVFYRRQPTYHPQMRRTGRKSHSRGQTVARTVNHYNEFVNTPVVEQDGEQYPLSVVKFRRPKLPKGQGHPSQKPVALMRWLIRTFTDPGDLVLDSVAGSGTTLVAARAEGRRAIGIELHEPYVEMAAARLASGSEGDKWR
jgi:site-specific DNA-methyltransferase (adenine-specific)/modification methylase